MSFRTTGNAASWVARATAAVIQTVRASFAPRNRSDMPKAPIAISAAADNANPGKPRIRVRSEAALGTGAAAIIRGDPVVHGLCGDRLSAVPSSVYDTVRRTPAL